MLVCFLLLMFALFMVPALLVMNGIQMIRRESLSPAHILSLALGMLVGVGELAAVFYVLGLSDFMELENMNHLKMINITARGVDRCRKKAVNISGSRERSLPITSFTRGPI